MTLQDNYKITLLEVLDHQDFSSSYRLFCKTFLFDIKIEQLITLSLCERRVALGVPSALF